MKEITSKTNNKIKEIVKLLNSSKRRNQSGLFVVEGLRLCVDAVKSGYCPVEIFVTEEFCSKEKNNIDFISNKCQNIYKISNDVLTVITDTVNPQGIVCVFEYIQNELELCENGKYVVLFDIADPSNLGAISRTAEALGIDALLIIGGCDIYNSKALRASMGALFRLPVLSLTSKEMFEKLKLHNIKTYASTPRETAQPITECIFENGVALLIGNEANGLNDETIELCDYAVTIPMSGRAESLNAAAASAILIFEMVRG